MKRLSSIESYLFSRSKGRPFTSIFNLHNQEGFPNRFYNTSQQHKDLRQAIRDKAQMARQAKLRELATAKMEYNRLNKLYLDAECEYITTIKDS